MHRQFLNENRSFPTTRRHRHGRLRVAVQNWTTTSNVAAATTKIAIPTEYFSTITASLTRMS
jgi:hypothetical protein